MIIFVAGNIVGCAFNEVEAAGGAEVEPSMFTVFEGLVRFFEAKDGFDLLSLRIDSQEIVVVGFGDGSLDLSRTIRQIESVAHREADRTLGFKTWG